MRRSILALAIVTVVIGCGTVWHFPFGFTVNAAGSGRDPLPDEALRRRIQLPPGFSISTYATGIDDARFLRFTSKGDLLVSSPPKGSIFLVEADADRDGAGDGVRELVKGLNRPHGVDVHDGFLYVGEGDAVARVRFDAEMRTVSGPPERIVRGLPSGGNHWTRTVAVGPDGKLYVSVGSSCNVCIEDDQRRAAMLRYDIDGGGETVYASGLRNSVGFAWRPGTGELYATDNGRDLLGDDFPPCELNRIVEGGFYGWPFANGNRIPDPDYGRGREEIIAASIPPAHAFGAHTAPLGITFYTGAMFPDRYRGAAFVAQHGSWNRSSKSGYQVVALLFDERGEISEESFASGFEIHEEVSGRPVDVAVGPDGALYVSDDFTGAIYRIAYGEAARSRKAEAAVPMAAPVAKADPLAALDPAERGAAAERGRKLFETVGCVSCHVEGQQLHGETYKPLQSLAGRHTIDSLAAFLAAPQPPMPLYPFTDAQRRDLAVYLLGAKG